MAEPKAPKQTPPPVEPAAAATSGELPTVGTPVNAPPPALQESRPTFLGSSEQRFLDGSENRVRPPGFYRLDDDTAQQRVAGQLEAPRADIHEGPEQIICRPPAGHRLEAMGDIVHGNWIGRHKGQRCSVLHGTPINGLPSELVNAIVRTRGQVVGPYVAPPPKNAGLTR